MTLTMNELVRAGNFPPNIFAEGSFQTASDYFQELSNQHFHHLQHQRNNAIRDEKDCRTKYIARCLFRKITNNIRTRKGPFRLYCDGFRPSNVLVTSESDLSITGIIDWEFTYIAPVEFSHPALWWLLFEAPEEWEADLHIFLDRYKPRLQIFLQALKEVEDQRLRVGSLKQQDLLSARMAESLHNGIF